MNVSWLQLVMCLNAHTYSVQWIGRISFRLKLPYDITFQLDTEIGILVDWLNIVVVVGMNTLTHVIENIMFDLRVLSN